MVRQLVIGVFAAGCFFCSVAMGSSLYPTDDAMIDEVFGGVNRGGDTFMKVRSMNLAGAEMDGLLKFDLSSVPSGAVVQSATMYLDYYAYNDGSPTGRQVDIFRITSDWEEGTVTWNSRPSYDGAAVASSNMINSYGWMHWDVTSSVQDIVDGAVVNFGWQIMDVEATGNNLIYFRSKEFGDIFYRPYLEVDVAIIYVDSSAGGGDNGSSWSDAYLNLQDGLNDATAGDAVWVAQGSYRPDAGGGESANDRGASFALANDVTLYGGFAGGETSVFERDWESHVTVLSGEIGAAGTGDNSYHVVVGSGVNSTAVLDGFTVRDGNASGGGLDDEGGGMYSSAGSATVKNCRFVANIASGNGGGMCNREGSSPGISDCVFDGNLANNGGGMYNYLGSSPVMRRVRISNNNASDGGGMYNLDLSNPKLTECVLSGNIASGGGGGMYSHTSCDAVMVYCEISGNSAVDGGGFYNFTLCDPSLTNSVLVGNSASNNGGGMYNDLESEPDIVNCAVNGNSASGSGGGIYNTAGPPDNVPTVTNSIVWGNSDSGGTDESAQIHGGVAIVSYSCIQDSVAGDYNIPFGGLGNNNTDGDPRFIDAAGGDLRLSGNSACLDGGSNAAVPADVTDADEDGDTAERLEMDMFGGARLSDGDCDAVATVDMGVHELEWIYLGDLDEDCDVDIDDVGVLCSHFLEGK